MPLQLKPIPKPWATADMETWLALTLITKAAAATLKILDKHNLLGMSRMTPTCLWRPVQGVPGEPPTAKG